MTSLRRLLAVSTLGCTLVWTEAAFASKEDDPFGCSDRYAASWSVSDCNRESLRDLANEGLSTLSYAGARERMFQEIDVYVDESDERVVDCVYTDKVFRVGTQGIPHNGVNTEHSWPQSFLKQAPRYEESRSDLHHLFPVDERENSRRSNRPFAECPGEPAGGDGLGELCSSGYEVPEGHKGRLARAMFYVSVTYDLKLDAAQEQTLRQWNRDFPVDGTEWARNEAIFGVQRNRNPFVAHPEWVELVRDF